MFFWNTVQFVVNFVLISYLDTAERSANHQSSVTALQIQLGEYIQTAERTVDVWRLDHDSPSHLDISKHEIITFIRQREAPKLHLSAHYHGRVQYAHFQPRTFFLAQQKPTERTSNSQEKISTVAENFFASYFGHAHLQRR